MANQLATRASEAPESYWLSRSVCTVLFLAVVLTLAGVYAFFQMPIAVAGCTQAQGKHLVPATRAMHDSLET